jgi:hypothetical protein
MFFLCPWEYKDIVNEDQYKLIQIFHEHLIHQVQKVGGCIGQSKRHNCVLVQSISCTESYLWYARLLNFQLVLPWSQVNFGKDVCSFHLVEQNLDPRERILVLNSHFIQGPIIHAHPLCSIFLFYEQCGCSPRGWTRVDKSFQLQLGNLLLPFH